MGKSEFTETLARPRPISNVVDIGCPHFYNTATNSLNFIRFNGELTLQVKYGKKQNQS